MKKVRIVLAGIGLGIVLSGCGNISNESEREFTQFVTESVESVSETSDEYVLYLNEDTNIVLVEETTESLAESNEEESIEEVREEVEETEITEIIESEVENDLILPEEEKVVEELEPEVQAQELMVVETVVLENVSEKEQEHTLTEQSVQQIVDTQVQEKTANNETQVHQSNEGTSSVHICNWVETDREDWTVCAYGFAGTTIDYTCTECGKTKSEEIEREPDYSECVLVWEEGYRAPDTSCTNQIIEYCFCATHTPTRDTPYSMRFKPGPGHEMVVVDIERNECLGTVTEILKCKNCPWGGSERRPAGEFDGTGHLDMDRDSVCENCGERCVVGEHKCGNFKEDIMEQEPTCHDYGYLVTRCSFCNREFNRESIEPYGHNMVDIDRNAVPFDFLREDSVVKRCTICGIVEEYGSDFIFHHGQVE